MVLTKGVQCVGVLHTLTSDGRGLNTMKGLLTLFCTLEGGVSCIRLVIVFVFNHGLGTLVLGLIYQGSHVALPHGVKGKSGQGLLHEDYVILLHLFANDGGPTTRGRGPCYGTGPGNCRRDFNLFLFSFLLAARLFTTLALHLLVHNYCELVLFFKDVLCKDFVFCFVYHRYT